MVDQPPTYILPSLPTPAASLSAVGSGSDAIIWQALSTLGDNDAERRKLGEICTQCGHADKNFSLTTITCDGECNGTKIGADQVFYELPGADTQYCSVSRPYNNGGHETLAEFSNGTLKKSVVSISCMQ